MKKLESIKKYLLMLVIAFFGLGSACSLARTYSTGEDLFKWDKKEVIVCWQDNSPIKQHEFSEGDFITLSSYSEIVIPGSALKKEIQTLIQAEFTLEKTGISFSGWQSCKGLKSYDLIIITSNLQLGLFDGEATIGREDDEDSSVKKKTLKNFVYLNLYERERLSISTRELVLMTALHEFGHVAGLKHEHIRYTETHGCLIMRESRAKNTDFFSAYDPSSIMNYCYTEFINSFAGFSFYRDVGMDPSSNQKRLKQDIDLLAWSGPWPYTDDSIFTKEPVPGIKGLLKYQVRIGLSKGDLHGLRCMYVYDRATRRKICHEDFNLE